MWIVVDFFIFPHMGQTRELSVEYLRHLSGQCTRSKLNHVTLKSLRPLGVKVGNLFTMNKTTVFVMIVVVSNLTVDALLLN